MGGSGGRGTSTTTANIPTELRPLFANTGRETIKLQGKAPVSGFLDPNPAGVADLSGTTTRAIGGIPGIGETPEAEVAARRGIGSLPGIAGRTPGTERLSDIAGTEISNQRLSDIAGQGVSAEALRNSPFLSAADDFFKSEILPGIENRATLSGLGRSTAVTNATSKTRAANALQALQAAQSGEEARISRILGAERTGQQLEEGRVGRQIGAETTGIGVRERGIGREAAAVESGIQNLRGLGGAETGRRLSEFEAGLRGGDIERGVEQERFNAENADAIRRQGISEQALFGPLGQLPSTFGQTTRSSTGK